jgi:hypothetical protein
MMVRAAQAALRGGQAFHGMAEPPLPLAGVDAKLLFFPTYKKRKVSVRARSHSHSHSHSSAHLLWDLLSSPRRAIATAPWPPCCDGLAQHHSIAWAA